MLRRAGKERNLFKKLYYYFEGRKIEGYEKKNLQHYDVNITCSSLDSDRLREIVPKLNVEEIPNGVDLSYFNSNRDLVEKNSLIFVGGLNWYPNKEAIIHFSECIWPQLRSLLDGIQFNLVGKNPPKELEILAESDADFKIHGYVKDARIFINKAEIYVCPILDGGGTKLKILDALAMKIPIVAYEIACEGIDVVHRETVLMGNTPEELISLTQELLSSPDLAKTLSLNGRKLIEEKYSFASIGAKLAALLGEICAAKR